MEGAALLGVFVLIAMLARWLYEHDKAPDQRTTGLFALREPAAPGEPEKK